MGKCTRFIERKGEIILTKPKHNPETELGVIGSLIDKGDHNDITIQKAMLNLEESYFYKRSHQELFKLIKKCFDDKQPFDVMKMLDLTQNNDDLSDIIGRAILARSFTDTRLESEINELKTAYQLRCQFNVLRRGVDMANHEPLIKQSSEIMANTLREAGDIQIRSKTRSHVYKDIREKYLAGEYQTSAKVEHGIRQFPVFRNGSLITIAGDSGIGKTMFGLYLFHQIVERQKDKQALYFSIEMKENEMWERHVSLVAEKPIEQLSQKEVIFYSETIERNNIKILHEPRVDIEYIETTVRIESINKPISVIVIDYLGLVTSLKRYDREDIKYSDFAQRLAALALEHNCIVICLSQVNRDLSKRNKDDRCPYTSDVADSVGSVRSSSLWLGIDRPENHYPEDELQFEQKNLFVVKCRKTRHDKMFEAYFDFNGGCFRERAFKPKIAPKMSFKDKFVKQLGEF